MPFPWEEAFRAGIQIGGSYAKQKQQSGAQEKEIGAAFDVLDKNVAAFFTRLMSQATLSPADVEAVANAYGQLQGFAQQYGSVEYVARQWAEEKPRYDQFLQILASKIPGAANAANPQTATNAEPTLTAPGAAASSGSGLSLEGFGGIALIGLGLLLVVIMKR